MNEQQNEFKGFAKVEVMGHQSHLGFVTTEVYGTAVLFRIDRPALPEEEVTLTEREWFDGIYLPVGSIVKYAALEGVSVLVGSASIYRIIPCTEAAVMKAIRNGGRRPLMVVSTPEEKLSLTAASVDDDDDEDDPLEDEHRGDL